MLPPSDIIHLPYTPDLSEGGIAYACRSLAYTYDRMGGSPVDRLRRIAAGVAVELAFRRYLGEQSVPFDVLGSTPFTDPDHYDVSLGGHRCDVKSYLLSRRRQVALVRNGVGPQLADLLYLQAGHNIIVRSQDIEILRIIQRYLDQVEIDHRHDVTGAAAEGRRPGRWGEGDRRCERGRRGMGG